MNDVAPQTRAAKHLTQIVAMYPDLQEQAVARAGDGEPGSDKILGGDAMVMRGPAANRSYVAYRQMSELMGRLTPPAETYESEADPPHPEQTLAYWADELRAERGEPTSLAPTVKRCADYIRQALDWAWSDQAEEFDADGMLADLAGLRARMENVLKQGHRPDRTEVPCLEDDCATRLIKEWHTKAAYDGYRCPRCERFYDRDAFLRAKANHLASNGAQKHVKLQDAVAVMKSQGRSERTFRKWVRYWHVRTYTEASTGQVWAWWPDVRETHADTPTRNRRTA